jgi:hypothetical protein
VQLSQVQVSEEVLQLLLSRYRVLGTVHLPKLRKQGEKAELRRAQALAKRTGKAERAEYLLHRLLLHLLHWSTPLNNNLLHKKYQNEQDCRQNMLCEYVKEMRQREK